MNEKQTIRFPLTAAYPFGAAHGLDREVKEIKDMEIEWDRSYTSTVRRGYLVELFEQHGIFDEFKVKHWTDGNTHAGETHRKRYLLIMKEYKDFLAGRGLEGQPDEDSETEEGDQQFADESDLRDFLAKNPGSIEQGLHLYQSGDQSGVEFPVEGGYIDILAIDCNHSFVVIELKVGRGRNKTIGQLLYYMGWVDKHLGNTPCRGVIIAKEISDDLVLAVQRVPGVSLYRYKLSVSVELVSSRTYE